jgi:elongation factor Ts
MPRDHDPNFDSPDPPDGTEDSAPREPESEPGEPQEERDEPMAITASDVRALRDATGAGMMDCKKALSEANGDLDEAIDWLRKKGLKSAEKKASREMGEGRVLARMADDGRSGALVAMTCETDFVAKTPDFEAFIVGLADHVLAHAPVDTATLLAQPWAGGGTVEEALKGLVGSLGENMSIADCRRLEVQSGWVGAYVHHDNRQGALVAIESGAEREKAEPVLKAMCQHLVVYSPPYCAREEVPVELVEREKDIYRDQVQDKPAEIQEKIIGGKLEKFYADQVFPEQRWIHDDKLTVAKALEQSLGKGSIVVAFAKFKVGG